MREKINQAIKSYIPWRNLPFMGPLYFCALNWGRFKNILGWQALATLCRLPLLYKPLGSDDRQDSKIFRGYYQKPVSQNMIYEGENHEGFLWVLSKILFSLWVFSLRVFLETSRRCQMFRTL